MWTWKEILRATGPVPSLLVWRNEARRRSNHLPVSQQIRGIARARIQLSRFRKYCRALTLCLVFFPRHWEESSKEERCVLCLLKDSHPGFLQLWNGADTNSSQAWQNTCTSRWELKLVRLPCALGQSLSWSSWQLYTSPCFFTFKNNLPVQSRIKLKFIHCNWSICFLRLFKIDKVPVSSFSRFLSYVCPVLFPLGWVLLTATQSFVPRFLVNCTLEREAWSGSGSIVWAELPQWWCRRGHQETHIMFLSLCLGC